MLLEHLPLLRDKRVVLASASPRRKELLALLGLRFEVRQCRSRRISLVVVGIYTGRDMHAANTAASRRRRVGR